uniref:Reverse transcriptase domain-containing protein n=3 Tax=Sphaeramia orbicularis TaxID=375764 RepID=A0A672Z783_9TELE
MALKEELINYDWHEVYVDDVNESYNAFLDIFLTLYNRHCPVKEYRQDLKKNKKPWLTKGLEKACKKKNSLYREFLKHRTKEKENKYKRYKNRLTAIIRTHKKAYYDKLLEIHKNDIKGTWKVLNDMIKKSNKKNFATYVVKNGDTVVENTEDIVNIFNDFFVNVGPNLAKDITKWEKDDKTFNFAIENNNSMFLGGVCESEVLEVVRKSKNKKSTDRNSIDMSLIKQVINSILQPFTYICNKSFQTGTFPENMKIAKVIPIYKNGDKHMVSNYRPVSLLPQFSKILEKLFVKRLDDYIDKYRILNDHQYGFRKNRSTSLAVMEFAENIATAVDQKQHTVGVFIDLRKAFDTIDHSILLRKCEMYGIRGVTQNWLKSYLQNRSQYVSIGNTNSQLRNVTCGVPQGSVLGPKLFILYLNDIFMASSKLKFTIFADDTNLLYSGVNMKQILEIVEKELSKLKKWFDVNKLSLNEDKTKFMVFGGARGSDDIKLKINEIEIERVYETKFLGVIIDHKLCWKPQIEYIKRKMSKAVAILYKTRDLLSKKCLHMLYCSLVMPYMSYCVEIWGNVYKTNLDPIIKLQKKAIRVINKAGYLQSSNPLFVESGLLKFLDIVYLKTMEFMFHVKSKNLPFCIQKIFKLRKGHYNLRGMFVFEKCKVRTNVKYHSVSVIGVKLWNELKDEVKLCSSLLSFKKNLIGQIMKGYESNMFTK